MGTAKKGAVAKGWSLGRLFGGKKGKGKPEPEILWTVRLGRWWASVRVQLAEIFAGLRSPDGPTRRMSVVFFLSLFGFLGVAGFGGKMYWQQRMARMRAQAAYEEEVGRMGNFFAKTAEEAKRRNTIQEIGKYSFSLKRPEGAKKIPGVIHMGEIELYAECDERETCTYVDENMTSVRNHVTSVFVEVERDDILTREGKRRYKKQLLDRLNVWLPRGKIKNIYISRLILS